MSSDISPSLVNLAYLINADLEILTPILRGLLQEKISLVKLREKCTTIPELSNDIPEVSGYDDFHLTLLYKYLRYICSDDYEPTNGWGVKDYADLIENVTVGDDIEKIKLIHDEIYEAVKKETLSEENFKMWWERLINICARLQRTQLSKLREIRGLKVDFSTYSGLIDKFKYIEQEAPLERPEYQPGQQYKEKAAQEKEVRIILLGKLGAGKSTSGNAILGDIYFRAESSWKTVTRECSYAFTTRNGKRYQLYDTPGFGKVRDQEGLIRDEIKRCLFFAAPGFHVLALVISCAERLTEQDQEALEKLDVLLGESACKYMIIIFTRVKSRDILLRMISEAPEISKLNARCDCRYVWFGNNEKEIPSGSINDFYRLVHVVMLNNAKRANVHYQHKLFKRAQVLIEKHAKTLQQQDVNMSEEEARDRAREISINGRSPYDNEIMKETEESCCIII